MTGMNTNRLTTDEAERLMDLEAEIQRGITDWTKTALALAEIREKRLYREKCATFEQYVEQRWGMSASRAYQLIRSGSVISNVDHMSTLSERQARELSKLPAEQQAEAFEKAGGNGARLADLEAVVEAQRPARRRRKTKRKPKPIVVRGAGWKVTVDRRSDSIEVAEVLRLAAEQLELRRKAA